MEGFMIASLVLGLYALIGLILLVVGILFLFKNIKWKGEKDRKHINSTSNIVGIICFSIMIFFGAVWFLCFGIGAFAMLIISLGV